MRALNVEEHHQLWMHGVDRPPRPHGSHSNSDEQRGRNADGADDDIRHPEANQIGKASGHRCAGHETGITRLLTAAFALVTAECESPSSYRAIRRN